MKMIENHTQSIIDGNNVFDKPINSMTKTYENIKKLLQAKEMTIKLVVY